MDPAFRTFDRGPTAHKAFGLRLHELTLGHVFLLCSLHVDFLVDEVEPELSDLLTLALVASQPTASRARRLMTSRWLRPLCTVLGFAARRRSLTGDAAQLRTYLREQMEAPKVLPPGADRETITLRAPEHWRLLAMLMSDFNMPRSEAMETTLSFARALWAAEGERRDKHSLAYSPATEAALRRIVAQRSEQASATD